METSAANRLAERIRLARSNLGLTQAQVAARLGLARSAVSDVEAGKRDVSAAELVSLAQYFGTSIGELLGLTDEQPGTEELMFRAASLADGTRLQLQQWQRQCEAYRELEAAEGEAVASVRPVASVVSSFEQADALADEERSRLGLGSTPAHTLLGVIEDRLRVKVLFLELDDGLSGASMSSRVVGPSMLVNRTHSPGRRVFTLAHEYFHLLVRAPVAGGGESRAFYVCEDRVPRTRDRIEQLADRFAGRLLLPPEHFIDRLTQIVRPGRTADEMDLIALARYFGVSVQAVFVQLAVLRLVPWETAVGGYRDAATQRGILQAEPEHGPEPQRLRRLAIRAHRAGRLSKARLAELLDVRLTEVDEVLQLNGGDGGERGISVALPG